MKPVSPRRGDVTGPRRQARQGKAVKQPNGSKRTGYCINCGEQILIAATNEEWIHVRTLLYGCQKPHKTVAQGPRK